MAILSQRAGLARYRRYLETLQERPLLQASLFLVFSLSLLIVLVALALKPTVVTIAGLFGQIDEQTNIERKLDQKISNLNKAKQVLQSVQPQLNLLDQALPTSAHFANWSQIVETLASSNAVEIVTLSFSQVPFASTNTTLTTNYPFTLTVRGDFQPLRLFLTALENTRRVASLESLTLTPQVTAEGSSRLQMVVNGLLTLSIPAKL